MAKILNAIKVKVIDCSGRLMWPTVSVSVSDIAMIEAEIDYNRL